MQRIRTAQLHKSKPHRPSLAVPRESAVSLDNSGLVGRWDLGGPACCCQGCWGWDGLHTEDSSRISLFLHGTLEAHAIGSAIEFNRVGGDDFVDSTRVKV